MKSLKLIAIASICAALQVGAASVFASPKPLKQAEKLAGNFTRLDEARSKVAEVLADTTLPRDAYTYYVAGKVEEGAFRHYYKLLAINRNDPGVDRTRMADALLNAIDFYQKALCLDTITDKKGRRRTQYSERIAEWLNSVTPSLYNAGVAYMNKRMYYPQAYKAFSTYACAPEQYYYQPAEGFEMNDSIKANAWYYAGVMAYNAGQHEVAARAFTLARRLGYPRKEVILNEMSCFSRIAADNPALADSLSRSITALAGEGLGKFGLSDPIFLKKYIAGLIYEDKADKALEVVDSALLSHNHSTLLHSMRAALLSRAGNITEASAEYRIAAAAPQADATTLHEAAKTLAREGLTLLDTVHGTGKAARNRRAQIKADYLAPALEYARRADLLTPGDPDIANTIETISYYML